MKLVVQRVEKAKVVRVSDQKTVGSIENGLLVLEPEGLNSMKYPHFYAT